VLFDIRKNVAEVRAGLMGPSDGSHGSAQFDGLPRALDDLGRAFTEPFHHVVVVV
jgi:hypothetical protein